MATNFPASLDSLTNPTSSDSLNSPSHSAQHANVNDAVEALQAKVGADSSAVTSSLDYKVAQLEAISHGKILQVIQATHSTEESTTSATFVSSSLSATITPTSATSKVLAVVNASVTSTRVTNINSGIALTGLDRGGIVLVRGYGLIYEEAGTNATRQIDAQQTLMFLDSPATTSATTYTLVYATVAGTTTLFRGNQTGVITLMEVAA